MPYFACPDATGGTVVVSPQIASPAGHLEYRSQLRVTLVGDSGTHPGELIFDKDMVGQDIITDNNYVGALTGIDWSQVGPYPKLKVEWSYGYGEYPWDLYYGANPTDPDLMGLGTTQYIDVTQAPSVRVGSGTAAAPYLIGTAAQLQDMHCTTDEAGTAKHYRLTNDIDLASVTGYLPIGAGDRYVTGVFDGNDHTISNLTINLPSRRENTALFGVARGLWVRDLTMEDASITGVSEVGVLAGRFLRGSTISNVEIDNATVTASNDGAGLVAGEVNSTNLRDSTISGTVNANLAPYLGADPAYYFDNESSTEVRLQRFGAIYGQASYSTIDDVIANATVNVGSVPGVRMPKSTEKIGGALGRADQEILINGLKANFTVNVTALDADSGIGGVLGGQGLDEGTYISDSDVNTVLTVQAPVTSNPVSLSTIGGLSGLAQEGGLNRVNLTGSVTVDARNATGPVEISHIGGGFGRVGSGGFDRSHVVESHIDVDVVIHGNAREVGAFTGRIVNVLAHNVRVDGSVTINGDGTDVGGLAGIDDTSGLQNSVSSVIWRGTTTITGASTDTGNVWGPDMDAVYGSNVWWNSTINGITDPDPIGIAAPATTAQLADEAWLATQGFSPYIWCVSDGSPAVRALTPGCAYGPRNGAPSAPGQPTVVGGTASATVTWTAPGSAGRYPITKYIVTSIPGNLTCETDGALTCDVYGLTPGVTYTFTVVAQNARGNGATSMPSAAFVAPNVELPETGANLGSLYAAITTLLLGAVMVRLARRKRSIANI